jgi:hypothetical protein
MKKLNIILLSLAASASTAYAAELPAFKVKLNLTPDQFQQFYKDSHATGLPDTTGYSFEYLTAFAKKNQASVDYTLSDTLDTYEQAASHALQAAITPGLEVTAMHGANFHFMTINTKSEVYCNGSDYLENLDPTVQYKEIDMTVNFNSTLDNCTVDVKGISN